jgi:hypothetical protein
VYYEIIRGLVYLRLNVSVAYCVKVYGDDGVYCVLGHNVCGL